MTNNDKTFFLIPGFRTQSTDKPFRWLVTYLENEGIRVVKTPIEWNHRTLSENTTEFVEFFSKHRTKENYVLGFSYGAVIALLTANFLKPKMIYLCSLSADFSEDHDAMDPWVKKYIGKKRYADIKTRSGRKLARQLLVPSVIFYGGKEGREYPQLKKRCEETSRLARGSKLIIVKNSPHHIDFPEYVEAIKKEIVSSILK